MLSICNYDIGNIRIYFIHRKTYFLNKDKTILNIFILIYYLIVSIYLQYLNFNLY
jgi:hypothetical protein